LLTLDGELEVPPLTPIRVSVVLVNPLALQAVSATIAARVFPVPESAYPPRSTDPVFYGPPLAIAPGRRRRCRPLICSRAGSLSD
jgi:hypothetical protein